MQMQMSALRSMTSRGFARLSQGLRQPLSAWTAHATEWRLPVITTTKLSSSRDDDNVDKTGKDEDEERVEVDDEQDEAKQDDDDRHHHLHHYSHRIGSHHAHQDSHRASHADRPAALSRHNRHAPPLPPPPPPQQPSAPTLSFDELERIAREQAWNSQPTISRSAACAVQCVVDSDLGISGDTGTFRSMPPVCAGNFSQSELSPCVASASFAASSTSTAASSSCPSSSTSSTPSMARVLAAARDIANGSTSTDNKATCKLVNAALKNPGAPTPTTATTTATTPLDTVTRVLDNGDDADDDDGVLAPVELTIAEELGPIPSILQCMHDAHSEAHRIREDLRVQSYEMTDAMTAEVQQRIQSLESTVLRLRHWIDEAARACSATSTDVDEEAAAVDEAKDEDEGGTTNPTPPDAADEEEDDHSRNEGGESRRGDKPSGGRVAGDYSELNGEAGEDGGAGAAPKSGSNDGGGAKGKKGEGENGNGDEMPTGAKSCRVVTEHVRTTTPSFAPAGVPEQDDFSMPRSKVSPRDVEVHVIKTSQTVEVGVFDAKPSSTG